MQGQSEENSFLLFSLDFYFYAALSMAKPPLKSAYKHNLLPLLPKFKATDGLLIPPYLSSFISLTVTIGLPVAAPASTA